MSELGGQFLLKVVAAAFAAVGIEEYLKNFFKPKNKKLYALVMVPLSLGAYCAAELLPIYVIGSLLTLGSVQVCYETLIQGFRAVIDRISGKLHQYEGPGRRKGHDFQAEGRGNDRG